MSTNNYIRTFTGKQFYPFQMHRNEYDIHDIAHALSNLCRYNGHSKLFYSVGQHSVYVSKLVSREDALEALLHDAAEAYIGDIPRPMKRTLPFADFCEIEREIELGVARTFNLKFPWPMAVRHADEMILALEMAHILHGAESGTEGEPLPLIDHQWIERMIDGFEPWAPLRAEEEFILRFNELRP